MNTTSVVHTKGRTWHLDNDTWYTYSPDCFETDRAEPDTVLHDILGYLAAVQADLAQLTEILAGIDVAQTSDEALRDINLLPSVQATWDRELATDTDLKNKADAHGWTNLTYLDD